MKFRTEKNFLRNEATQQGGADEVTNQNQNTKSEQVVEAKDLSKEHFDRIKKEKENLKKALSEAEAKSKKLEEEKLISENNYKALAENRLQQLNEKEKLLNEMITKEVNYKKVSALKQELLKAGASQSEVDSLAEIAKLDDIKIDPDNGVLYGIDNQVKALKEKLPSVFSSKPNNANHSQPNIDIKNYQLADVEKMKTSEVKKLGLEGLYKLAGVSIQEK